MVRVARPSPFGTHSYHHDVHRYLLEFTSEAVAEYPGLGVEVWGLPGQAWITVRLTLSNLHGTLYLGHVPGRQRLCN